MPTPYQKRLIKDFEEAVREHAFIGAQMDEDHDAIEEDYERAKDKLERAFDRLPHLTKRQREVLKELLYDQTQVPTIMDPGMARQIYEQL